jgi:ribosomal-protein-serine acetyltransferase
MDQKQANDKSLVLNVDQHTDLILPNEERASEFMSLIDRSRPYLREWLAWLDGTQTVVDLKKFIDMVQQDFIDKKAFAMWIVHRNEIVGIVHLRDIDVANRKAMIGYWVGQQYRGRGFAKTATRTLCSYAFNDRNLNRIEIRCATGNTASQAVPMALGFKREGVLRDNEWLYDHFVDHVVFSMLAADWSDQ